MSITKSSAKSSVANFSGEIVCGGAARLTPKNAKNAASPKLIVGG